MIYNHTRKNMVCEEVELAFTFFARLKGLMFRKSFKPQQGLLLSPCNSVHMFFMHFSIDVVFIDKGHKVIAVEHNLRPWQVSRRHRKAKYTLELAAGRIEATGLRIGDLLEYRQTPSASPIGISATKN